MVPNATSPSSSRAAPTPGAPRRGARMGCPGVPPPPAMTGTRNTASAPASVSSGDHNPCPNPQCLGPSSLSLTPQSSIPTVATAMELPASSLLSSMAPPMTPVPQMGAPMATAGVPPPPALTRTRNTASAPTEVPARQGGMQGRGHTGWAHEGSQRCLGFCPVQYLGQPH